MRNAPMRWIEQAERRQVLTQSQFERPANAPWSSTADQMAALLPRLGTWLAERHPMGLPAPQLQPVPVRHHGRRHHRVSDDYSARW